MKQPLGSGISKKRIQFFYGFRRSSIILNKNKLFRRRTFGLPQLFLQFVKCRLLSTAETIDALFYVPYDEDVGA